MNPKFRAWNKTWEEMGEVRRIRFYDNGSVSTVLAKCNGQAKNLTKDEVILMQSTGLHDKNGKEIFEGDILAIETDEGILNLNIFWDSKHALFMFESKKYNEKDLLAELVEDNTYPFEIVGNIYENPELLEVTERKDRTDTHTLRTKRNQLTGEMKK